MDPSFDTLLTLTEGGANAFASGISGIRECQVSCSIWQKTIADAALWNRRDSQHCMLSEAQPQSPALYIGQDQLVTFRPFCYE
jgi:hypothetical protein